MNASFGDKKKRALLNRWPVLILTCWISGNSVIAAPFTPGNFLVTHQNTLREYTRSGSLVQSIAIPYIGNDTPNERARDVVIGSRNRAYVYNGVFDPSLSEYDPATGVWLHRKFAGLSLVGNGSFGGLTSYKHYIFMPDDSTGGGEENGIVRFDLNGGPTLRFATNLEPFDLNIGLDGLLYALSDTGSPIGQTLDVYDPATLAHLRRIEDFASSDNRGVAVDRDGSLYIVSWNGNRSRSAMKNWSSRSGRI